VYRFLLQRRLGFALLVLVLAGVCVRLGFWQFDRMSQRREDNARIGVNLEREPVAVGDLVSAGGSVPLQQEWRQVSATGTYDPSNQVVVRYQSRESGRGVDVVTPLITSGGTAVLVDRGWMLGDSPGAADIPVAASGTVTVTGWLRRDSSAGAAATEPEQGQVRAVSSAGIAPTLGYPVYPGYVALTAQSPPQSGLAPAEPPDLGRGPHFFYGLQWFFFAGLALFGWFYFAWVEAHPRSAPAQRARTMPPSTGSIAPVTKEAAGDSRNAAALPNSSGRP
jgi:cytochrome oxidase assembly protein ShyY1